MGCIPVCFAGECPRNLYANGIILAAFRQIVADKQKQKSQKYDHKSCLLYTSDAADEEDSVDLGGRRIIKKKKQQKKKNKKIRKKKKKRTPKAQQTNLKKTSADAIINNE